MAYLDIDNAFASPQGARVSQREADTKLGFTPLEWTVIALAKRDTIRSLSQPGRIARAMGTVFGRGTASHLADPRLEALRRLAVHAWRHDFALPVAEIDCFLAAGFGTTQVETLVESITGLHVGQRSVAA